MSDSEASLIESKRIDGIVEQNEDFTAANGQIWRQNPKPLGKGGYSQVYLYENGGSLWAVKRIANISGGGRTDPADIKKEKAAMIKFSHQERFIDLIGWFANKNIEYFALEYMKLGDLEGNLKQRERPGKNILNIIWEMIRRENKKAEVRLPEAEVKIILTQILEGLEFMHAEGYIHRDLKPQNILVAQKGPGWQVKITDFGLSKYTLGVREGYSFTGTPPYMAPEIYNSMLEPSKYTNAIDMWAVGCIACRMLIGEPPFSDPWLLVQYLEAIKVSKPMDQLCREVPYIPKDLAELLEAKTSKGLFVRQLLEPEPEKRPSASQALGHPWFQGHDFCALRGHAQGVVQVAFSPNGEFLASASPDRTIRLWSVEERKRKHILESPGVTSAITFLLDGTLVASALIDEKSVRVWVTETGEVKHTFKRSLRLPSGPPVFALPLDKLLRVPLSPAFSPNGSLVAIVLEDYSTIELWDTEKAKRKFIVQDNKKTELSGITFSSNGELMALVYSDGTFRLWNTGKRTEERMFKGDPRIVNSVAFSPNGRVIALGNDEESWLWDIEEEEAKCVSEDSRIFVQAMIFSPDGKFLAVTSYFDEIRLYNTEQKRETRILKGHLRDIVSVAFSPNSQLLASASKDETVRLWDMEGKEQSILKAHASYVAAVAFSPKRKLVVTASADGLVGLWNVSQWMN